MSLQSNMSGKSGEQKSTVTRSNHTTGFNPMCVYPSSGVVFVLGTMGIVGNILLFCVMKRPHLKNKSYAHFLSALAISDNFNIVFIMFQNINYFSFMNTGHYLTSFFNHIGCKIFDFVERIFLFNSAWLIVCITVERFLVIYFPCRGRIFCRAKKALVIVIVVSVISCASQSFRLLWVIRDPEGKCAFDDNSAEYSVAYDMLCALILYYIIPSFTILVLNVLTLIRMNGFIRSNSSTTVTRLTQNSTTVGTLTNGCGNTGHGSLRNSTFNPAAIENGALAETPVDATNPQQHLLTPNGRENCTASTTSGATNATGQGAAHQLLLRYFPKLRRSSRRATWILLTISFTYMFCCLPDVVGEFYWHVKILILNNTALPFSHPDHPLNGFYEYFYCYSFVLKIFKTITYGSNFYTYILFGKSFRKEVTTLLNFSSSSGAHPCIIGHLPPQNHGNADGSVVMMRLPGAPGHGGIEAPPPDILVFNKLKSPHVPLADLHNKMVSAEAEKQKQNQPRYRNMPEFPL